MSLTQEDLQQIRVAIREEVESIIAAGVERHLGLLQDRLEALENDVKDIYFMISRLERGAITDQTFSKLTLEKKLLKLNAELLVAAKQAGITLPR